MTAGNNGNMELLIEAVSMGGAANGKKQSAAVAPMDSKAAADLKKEESTPPASRRPSHDGSESDASSTRSRATSKDGSLSSDAECEDEDAESSLLNQNGFTKTFPQRLFEVLNKSDTDNAIIWTPDGMSFVIVSPKALVQSVLPQYFKQTKFASFTRKLNRWGFKRMTKGMNAGAYFHKLFRRDNPDLCLQMFCQKSGEQDRLRASLGFPFGIQGNRGAGLYADAAAMSLLRERQELEAALRDQQLIEAGRLSERLNPTLGSANSFGPSALNLYGDSSRLQAAQANLDLSLDPRLGGADSSLSLDAMSQNVLANHNLAALRRYNMFDILSTQVGSSTPASPVYNQSLQQNPLRQMGAAQSLPTSPLVPQSTAAARLMEQQRALQQQQLSNSPPLSLGGAPAFDDFVGAGSKLNDSGFDAFSSALGQLRHNSVSPQAVAMAPATAMGMYQNQTEMLKAMSGVSLEQQQLQAEGLCGVPPLNKYARQA